ncbi:MAG: hypothetical protein R3A79_15320 [Nannocystaceae bacterium]
MLEGAREVAAAASTSALPVTSGSSSPPDAPLAGVVEVVASVVEDGVSLAVGERLFEGRGVDRLAARTRSQRSRRSSRGR